MSRLPYYADERITLYDGDSLAMLSALPDASIDAIITDPPYSSGGMTRSDRSGSTGMKYIQTGSENKDLADFAGDGRDQRAYAYWCALWLAEALRATKPQGVALMFTDWRQLPATTDALQAGGWIWRGIVPWFKPASRPQAGRFSAQCEYVVWGSRGGMTTDLTTPCLPGFYQASSPREREHQTQKPLTVMRELVKICPPGGTVLDPFMGSGTTGVAAIIEGRKFVGAEMVSDYRVVAERRIREAQGHAVPRGGQSAFSFEDAS